VFCVLVVLSKLSLLAKWLARKTPLRKPNRGERIVSRKPRPKSAHDFLGLLYYFIVLLCICVVSCHYVKNLLCGVDTTVCTLVRRVLMSVIRAESVRECTIFQCTTSRPVKSTTAAAFRYDSVLTSHASISQHLLLVFLFSLLYLSPSLPSPLSFSFCLFFSLSYSSFFVSSCCGCGCSGLLPMYRAIQKVAP